MSKLMDKVMNVIGFEVEEEEFIENNDSQWQETENTKRQKKSNLLSLPTQKPVTVMLVKADVYDEVESIAQNIKERRSVIVNFEQVDKEVAQRMIDFLSGAVFALEGTVEKVSAGTFLFATSNMDVMGRINEMEEGKEKSIFKGFSWSK